MATNETPLTDWPRREPPVIQLVGPDGPLSPDYAPGPGDADAPEDAAGDHAATAKAPRFRLLTDLELDAIPEAAPLVDGIVFENSLAALVGAYGTYKTFLLLDLAFCIAVGADWHGRRVRQGAVVYVYAEGAWGARRRLAALKTAYGYTGSAAIYFLPTSVLINDPSQVASLLLAIEEKLGAGAVPAAVFVDTVARNMGGNENDVEDMGQFIRGCDAIREAYDCTVFLAHHTGWNGARSRGSSSLPGAVSTEILAERDGDTVTLTCTKQKDAPEFEPITLEAFPIAGGLVFRTLVPTRAELTRNERAALTVVQASEGLSSTAWMDATELAKGSFNNARRRLLALAYVRRVKSKYFATDAATLALGTTDKTGTTKVQAARSEEVQRVHTPLGVNVVPDPVLDLLTNGVGSSNGDRGEA